MNTNQLQAPSGMDTPSWFARVLVMVGVFLTIAIIAFLAAQQNLGVTYAAPVPAYPDDAATQGIMNYIHGHESMARAAAPVDAATQGIMNYIRGHESVPPATNSVDAATQGVMSYIRGHESTR